ncbi:MAG: MBL fold metallo-hydrolase [Cellulosilyticaceae bacterium]
MKLKVLVDNNTYIDQYYCGEPAVSYYIEDEGTCLLLDVGYSDLFIKNATAFGLDLNKVSKVVISHGHDDHTRGLKYYFEQYANHEVSVIAHPDAFKEKVYGDLHICSPILEEELSQKCDLVLTDKPYRVSPHITFLGEIPQMNEFETRVAIGKQMSNDEMVDDYVRDDSALVYQNAQGIYIITGCSHSGICNIIEYAKEVCQEERVLGVIGGFHLFEVNERVDQTIAYLRQNQVETISPCHCTSFVVKAHIHGAVPIKEVGVGLEIIID